MTSSKVDRKTASGLSPAGAPPAAAPLTVLIITGLSGSGKSTVLRSLEDAGYFCVDNLPLSLLPPFLKEFSRSPQHPRKIALVMDVRTAGFLQNYSRMCQRLKRQGYVLHLLFLAGHETQHMGREFLPGIHSQLIVLCENGRAQQGESILLGRSQHSLVQAGYL